MLESTAVSVQLVDQHNDNPADKDTVFKIGQGCPPFFFISLELVN